MAGRRAVAIEMDVKSREGLQDLVRRHSSPQQLVKRAQIILEAADGKNHSQVARELKISDTNGFCGQARKPDIEEEMSRL